VDQASAFNAAGHPAVQEHRGAHTPCRAARRLPTPKEEDHDDVPPFDTVQSYADVDLSALSDMDVTRLGSPHTAAPVEMLVGLVDMDGLTCALFTYFMEPQGAWLSSADRAHALTVTFKSDQSDPKG
jgi:hypothetical protein